MDKKEAYRIVFEDLIKYSLFTGKYDAKNGNASYMNGIASVMEKIAYSINEETGDTFSDLLLKNLIESEERK